MGFFQKLLGRQADKRTSSAQAPKSTPKKKTTGGKVVCPNCNGSGRVFASMSMNTGEIQYRTCGQCQGKGRVEAKRAHYTTYPDKSLEIAQQLIAKHGRPEEIILENDGAGFADAKLLFDDGYEGVLGGFAVGYKGTRPDYLEAMLRAAGFGVTTDDIEKMSLPFHFTHTEKG